MQAARAHLTDERRYIVRNAEGGALLERFFVSGVVAFLLLRFYLELTGFPRVGGHGLHIAHMLWGGLLMLSAVVMLLGFLGGTIRHIAAVVGGVGFGIFIDELGKFITSDNNYFYRPAVALIYVIFVALFLVLRAVERQQARSESGHLLNCLDATGDAVLHGFDRHDRERALAHLALVPKSNPVAAALREALLQAAPAPDARPGMIARMERRLHDLYLSLIERPWFSRAVIAGVVAYAFFSTLALINVALTTNVSLRRGAISVRADLLFSLVADAMILVGVLLWRRSRLDGLIWFKRAILLTILVAQPFLFYSEQLVALVWLVVDLVALETLNYSIQQERLLRAPQAHGTAPAPPGAGEPQGAAGALGPRT